MIGCRHSDRVLLLRVASPPVGGAANKACTELLAETLQVRRSQVTLVNGATAREKRFEIAGMTDVQRDAVLESLPSVCEPPVE
ncbi:MAG: hypothetical protein OHK0029_06070 [Armatimonadaceae bacterium]